MQTTLNLLPDDWSQEHHEHVQKICRRAAQWWREQLGRPADANKYEAGAPVAAVMVGSVATHEPQYRLSQLESFEAELGAALYKQVVSRWRVKVSVLCIGTDYAPDELLAVAAAAHGISPNSFPWKTLSWIYSQPGEALLLVQAGRAGARQEIQLAA